MKSCIEHPHESFLIIRPWQLKFCSGNKCAALLLGIFEFWHNIKLKALEQNEKSGKENIDSSLLQWHTEDELQEQLLDAFSLPTIKKALDLLKSLGAITIHRNPSVRFKYDNTHHFLLHVETLEVFLAGYAHKQKSLSTKQKSAGTISVDNSLSLHSPHPVSYQEEYTSEKPEDEDASAVSLDKDTLSDPEVTHKANGLLDWAHCVPLLPDESSELTDLFMLYREDIRGLQSDDAYEYDKYQMLDTMQLEELASYDPSAVYDAMKSVITWLHLKSSNSEFNELRNVVFNGKQFKLHWRKLWVMYNKLVNEINDLVLPPIRKEPVT